MEVPFGFSTISSRPASRMLERIAVQPTLHFSMVSFLDYGEMVYRKNNML